MLKIEHLTKTYGGKPAVQDLCLHICPGELCAFIGHNGAGKTTTLKCCCGIQQFDAGEIYVDGISGAAPAPHAAEQSFRRKFPESPGKCYFCG